MICPKQPILTISKFPQQILCGYSAPLFGSWESQQNCINWKQNQVVFFFFFINTSSGYQSNSFQPDYEKPKFNHKCEYQPQALRTQEQTGWIKSYTFYHITNRKKRTDLSWMLSQNFTLSFSRLSISKPWAIYYLEIKIFSSSVQTIGNWAVHTCPPNVCFLLYFSNSPDWAAFMWKKIK